MSLFWVQRCESGLSVWSRFPEYVELDGYHGYHAYCGIQYPKQALSAGHRNWKAIDQDIANISGVCSTPAQICSSREYFESVLPESPESPESQRERNAETKRRRKKAGCAWDVPGTPVRTKPNSKREPPISPFTLLKHLPSWHTSYIASYLLSRSALPKNFTTQWVPEQNGNSWGLCEKEQERCPIKSTYYMIEASGHIPGLGRMLSWGHRVSETLLQLHQSLKSFQGLHFNLVH